MEMEMMMTMIGLMMVALVIIAVHRLPATGRLRPISYGKLPVRRILDIKVDPI